MKKVYVILFFVLVLCWIKPVRAEDEIQIPQLAELQETGDALLDDRKTDIREIFSRLMQGEDPLSAAELEQQIKSLLSEFVDNATLLLRQILLLLLFSAVFRVLSGIVQDTRISETGFYILYMLLATLLIRDFSEETEKIGTLLQELCSFMQVASAACSLAMVGAGEVTAAAFFTQGLLFLVTLTQWLIGRVFLPVTQCSVLLAVFDRISEKRLLSDLGELMEKAVLWGMKTVIAAVTGVQILRNMLAPALDTLKRSALGKAAQAIPGIGNMVGSAAEVLLASAVLIKSCLGIVILLILVMAGLSPLLHMVLKCAVFYLAAAFGQPVADPRIVGCIRAVARGYVICLKILSGTLLLFFLAVAVMAKTG